MVVEKMTFGEEEYIVIDKFEYKGIVYLLLAEDISEKIKGKDLGKLKENINMKMEFVYKCEDGMYENVVDDKLYNELMSFENQRNKDNLNKVLNIYLSQN